MICCVKRKTVPDEDDTGYKEGKISTYFRKYHAKHILSKPGKLMTIVSFTALIIFGVYGFMRLPVEDSARNFIPQDSYIKDYVATAEAYFPDSGTTLFITFESGENIYNNRDNLAALDARVSGLSDKPPYIAEPSNDSTYQNAMAGLKEFLATNGSDAIGGATLGEDGWPLSYVDFVATLKLYASFIGPGARYYAGNVGYDTAGDLEAYHTKFQYVRLTKEFRGETLDDASRQIEAMDATRVMAVSWTELQPAFPYADTYLAIESFKIVGNQLYHNVGLAIACVEVIVLITVTNVWVSILQLLIYIYKCKAFAYF